MGTPANSEETGAGTLVTTRTGRVMPMGRRFKPGQCGNPTGRPKGSLRLLIAEALRETVKVKGPRGKVREVTKARALVDAIIVEALFGRNNVQAFKEIRDSVDGRPAADEGDGGQSGSRVTVNVLQVLRDLPPETLRKLRAAVVDGEAKVVK